MKTKIERQEIWQVKSFSIARAINDNYNSDNFDNDDDN